MIKRLFADGASEPSWGMSAGQSITQSGDVILRKTSDVGFTEDIKRLALESILTQLSANG